MASVAGPRPPCGVHPSGFVVRSGCPAVWCAARLCAARPVCSPSGVRSPGVVVQGSGGPDGRCPPVQRPAVWCPPRPSGRVRPVHVRRWGPGRCGGRPPPQARVEVPVGAAAPSSSPGVGRRRPGRGRGCRGRASVSGVSVADAGRVGEGGGACPLPCQAGQAGARSARGWRLREGQGSRRQREVAAAAAWLPSSGWVGDHGGWWSWRLPRGWMGPEGPMGLAAGMGVRPQRGSGWQRARPACGQQRCDLRGWCGGPART
jgi:hypothetical protein